MTESLISLQKALSLLTINRHALIAFLDDPSLYCKENNLSVSDKNNMLALVNKEGPAIQLLSDILTERREEYIKLFLPHTTKLFKTSLWKMMYQEYMKSNKNHGMISPIKEALNFSNYILHEKDKYSIHGWQYEFIQYENLKCQILVEESNPASFYENEVAENLCPLIFSKYIIKEFSYNIPELILQDTYPVEVEMLSKKILLLLTKTWDGHGVVTLKVNNTITNFLKYCDGTKTMSVIYSELQKFNSKLEYKHFSDFFRLLKTKKIIVFVQERPEYE